MCTITKRDFHDNWCVVSYCVRRLLQRQYRQYGMNLWYLRDERPGTIREPRGKRTSVVGIRYQATAREDL
jgi:hypothetical protein